MRKVLINYFGFVIACVVVIFAFITATNFIQLAVAILLYPVLVVFAYRILPSAFWGPPKKPGKKPENPILAFEHVSPASEKSETKRETIGISDIDKRVFLKLIGGAGAFLFLSSIFNKKAESLFFQNVPGSSQMTSKPAPSQSQPVDGYRISEIDDDDISYYGFTNKAKAWYIMKVDTDTGAFRYASGSSNFPDSWAKRKELSYDYYNTAN